MHNVCHAVSVISIRILLSNNNMVSPEIWENYALMGFQKRPNCTSQNCKLLYKSVVFNI